jgi:hypothetical protein
MLFVQCTNIPSLHHSKKTYRHTLQLTANIFLHFGKSNLPPPIHFSTVYVNISFCLNLAIITFCPVPPPPSIFILGHSILVANCTSKNNKKNKKEIHRPVQKHSLNNTDQCNQCQFQLHPHAWGISERSIDDPCVLFMLK